MTAAGTERALVLLDRHRHAEAAAELRRVLADDPQDAVAHAILATALARGGTLDEATREAETAVGLAPDLAFAHHTLASVLAERNRHEAAARAVEEAVRLDPKAVDTHVLLAAIRHAQGRYAEAVAAADRALALEPAHAGALNVRSMALVQLGRRDEAHAGLDAALARDPEDPLSHATRGWALLDQGERERALEHFREALRLDPGQEWARRGIVEALKARHALYGLMLRYFLWMGKLTGRTQLGIWIGGWLLVRALRGVARENPALAPVIWPLLGLYLLFLFLTWTADPLFTLLLRLDRFGRHALLPEQVRASTWVGATLAAAAVAAAAGLLTGSVAALALAVFALLLVVPLSATFQCDPGWPRWVMGGYTSLLAAGAAIVVAVAALTSRPALPTALGGGLALLLGVVVSTWLGAWLTRVRPGR